MYFANTFVIKHDCSYHTGNQNCDLKSSIQAVEIRKSVALALYHNWSFAPGIAKGWGMEKGHYMK